MVKRKIGKVTVFVDEGELDYDEMGGYYAEGYIKKGRKSRSFDFTEDTSGLAIGNEASLKLSNKEKILIEKIILRLAKKYYKEDEEED